MKRELSNFQKIAEFGFGVIAVAVEFLLSYMTLYLNAWPAIQRGYWMVVWIPIIVWIVLTLLWVAVVTILFSRKKRKALKRSLHF